MNFEKKTPSRIKNSVLNVYIKLYLPNVKPDTYIMFKTKDYSIVS